MAVIDAEEGRRGQDTEGDGRVERTLLAFACLQLLLSGGTLLGGFQDSLARRSAAFPFGLQGFPPGLPFGSTLSLSVPSCLLPGLMQYSLSLLDACWPPHSAHSLPSSTVTSNLFSITHPARFGPAAQSWVELSPLGSGSQWLSSSSRSMALEIFANHQLGTVPSLSLLSPFLPSS